MAAARSSSGGVALYTSGFMDNVILAHKSDVAAQLMEAQSTRSLGLGYKGA